MNTFNLDIPYLEVKEGDKFYHSKGKDNGYHRIRFANSSLSIWILKEENGINIKLAQAIFSDDYQYEKIMGFLYTKILPLYK